MLNFKSVPGWVKRFLDILGEFLVPEDQKLKNLLSIEQGDMRNLLPKSPVNTKDAFVLFNYDNRVVKLLVKSIKFKNNSNVRKRIASYLYEELIDISEDISLFDGSPPILVPMPMSKKEKNKKGFNQCEEICKDIEKLSEGNIEIFYNILKKIKETERQTTLDRDKRLLNVRNSMQVFDPKEKIKNRTVVVLDDVYTTLASFTEARRALLEGGARRVVGLFIAH